ncbi:MAG: bifunctional DNA primase/polymerase [Solirubrobacterales bacterium]
MTQRRQKVDKHGDERLEAALGYGEAGIPVIPLHSINGRGVCTCGKAKCANAGKHPRIKHGLKEATADEWQIRKWWKRWPEANIAGVLGDHYVAIDVDVAEGKGGEESLRDLEGEYGEFPRTATAKTGKYGNRRGRHYFFTIEGGIGSSTGILGHQGVDLRGEGGYVVLPPSRHRSGVEYEWEVPLSEATTMPEALEETLRSTTGSGAVKRDPNWKPSGRGPSKAVRRLLKEGDWTLGEQRATAVRCSRALLDSGADSDEVVDQIINALDRSDQNSEEPWERRDVERLVDNLLKNPPPPLKKKQRPKLRVQVKRQKQARPRAIGYSGRRER